MSDLIATSTDGFGEVSRDLFDGRNNTAYDNTLEYGISPAVVRRIWEANHEPEWLLEHRLKCLEIFRSKKMPTWGPDLSRLDLEKICYYAKPTGAGDHKKWDQVPADIKRTFERLGIPQAEQHSLAGVGAQYDSEVVYHNLKKEYADRGVIFEDMSVAVHQHSDLLRSHFMKCVPPTDHLFAALHGAVWSGGTFLYVPAGVNVDEPLQAYFRMNARAGGQFEHTIIVLEKGAQAHYIEGCSAPKYGTSSLHAGCVEIYVAPGAKMRYSSVENWSIDTFNLNTKRAIVEEEGFIEWIGGNMGSGVTMLYPCSVLKGRRASAQHLGIAFANKGQVIDGGAKVIHIGKETSSQVVAKSLSKGGGVSTYRGLVDILPDATGSVSRIECDALILDDLSVSDTLPDIRVNNTESTVAHEASAGRISDEVLFYIRSHGIGEKEAQGMIVNGFIAPIIKELPLEYASEMNALIALEMENSVG